MNDTNERMRIIFLLNTLITGSGNERKIIWELFNFQVIFITPSEHYKLNFKLCI